MASEEMAAGKTTAPPLRKCTLRGLGSWTAPLSDRGYRMSAEVAAQQATYYIQEDALEYGYVARRPKSDGLRYGYFF